MAYYEEVGGVEVAPVTAPDSNQAAVFGKMHVYHRYGWRSLRLPKYVVCHTDGRALEDFRTKKAAFKWAAANQNG